MNFQLRKKIGCCSAFGSFEIPELGIRLVFGDDCRNHSIEEVSAIKPVSIDSNEAEYWLIDSNEHSFTTWDWFINGQPCSRENVIALYIDAV